MEGRVQEGQSPLLQQLGGMGERCELHHRGLESPRNRRLISQEINDF